MEIVLHKYKCMNFPGNEDSFYRRPFNMPFAHKAETFGYHQYSYRYDVESMDDYNGGELKGDCDKSDQGRKKKATVVPKPTQEKKLIDEILTLSLSGTCIGSKSYVEGAFSNYHCVGQTRVNIRHIGNRRRE